ncbi:phosphate ABC transporter substrate-binding protein PstS [Scleromatobacter humisilvae]|uniref:Phosphate-binding protein PstS n=1 Tax=Scleromatobacter humisilvae TaxID=2897159 RepID=A0A9X1YLY4_9BURK|nr:phosphate ABC transporter substrate-binding protein PstS [Scleromatobacter humisilvae]MCK9687178.1 phosphate ABC transporter substrate-binding protein PstS [Scleromatobacter humisilvae]
MSIIRSVLTLSFCVSAALPVAGFAAESISGAGSSAAAPVYKIWAAEYAKARGTTLDYAPVGSGAGMTKIIKHEVDFGASDFIASAADLKKNDLVMFPTVITGVVPVVNLGKVGPGQLHLTGDVLGRIFVGQITQWDAPEIKALNPGLKLPNRPIKLVARADGSGTTFHFSDYLSRTSAAWKAKYGVATHFDWPAGTLAVKGSGEIAKTVLATEDSIGYIDFNYVLDDNLVGVAMKNADGQFVTAGVEGFHQAVMRSTWYSAGDFSTEINDLPGAATWPITMGTYIAVPRVALSGERAERTLRFLTWAYLNGDALARQAKFVPLPDRVQASAYREISRVVSEQGELLGAKTMGSAMN